jgi:biotin synthase
MFNSTILNITEKIAAYDDWCISRDQALTLIPENPEAAMDLISCANKIRQWFKQQQIFKCGIVNAKSGRCPEDCAFCAQSVHHQSAVPIYALRGVDELVQSGLRLAAAGANNYSMVTSGTTLGDGEIDTVCRAAEILRGKSDLRVCASLGMLTERSARKLKAAGVSRYHHNLETAQSHFENICTTHDYEEDIQTVLTAKTAGLEVCSGGIFGMGESWEQRVELAFLLKELDVHVIPVNFLNPIEGTRLAQRPLLPPLEALACIALFRFIHPRKEITVCGGREVTLQDFQSWVFFAGANGLMVGNYLTTQGRNIEADLEMIANMGLNDAPAEDGR